MAVREKEKIDIGWIAPGITDTIRLGLEKLPPIDPFSDIDSMLSPVLEDGDDQLSSACNLEVEQIEINVCRAGVGYEDEVSGDSERETNEVL